MSTVRTNISIPNSVKKLMEDYKMTHDVNWSAVATAAFLRVMTHDSQEVQIMHLQKRVEELEKRLARIVEVATDE